MKAPLAQLPTQPLVTEREWTEDGIPVLTATCSLPQPAMVQSAAARRIRRYYQLQRRCFFKYCEAWLLPQARAEYHAALDASRPLPCFRAELGYCVTWNQGGLWSLYTHTREAGPAGAPLLTRRGDTWDLSAGYPIPLQDFFPGVRGWKRTLLSFAAGEITRQEAAGVARYHEHWRQALRRHFNGQNYYLTEDGLAFFYPMYAIAPSAEGIPVFTLPYGTPGLRQPAQEPPP